MGLTVALNNALSGLNVNQQQLTVLSQNIANANTPGYSKQTAQQDSVYLNGTGQGVTITQVTRKVDEYLNKAVQNQNSIVAATGVINDYSTRIQLLLGNPGDKNSIDAYINTYTNAVQSLAQTPQNTTLQQSTINAGVSLASQISDLATSLQNLQFQADQDIATAVQNVNTNLKRLNDLNHLINTNASLGKSVAELEDQRDRTVQDIGQYINISTFTQNNGALSATTGNGIPILDNNAYQISYKPTSSASAFADGSSLGPMTIIRLDNTGAPSGEPIVLANAGPSSSIASVFTSGKIAGLMEMRDRQIPALNAQLDNLSANLRDNINAIHNTGSSYPGANAFTGTRPVFAQQINQWSGSARIAVLDSNGQPVASPYADEPNGFSPLTLDLAHMDTLSGVGNPSVQGIIDTINQYYGTPQNKLELGNLNNIQLVSDTASIPATPPKLSFDFNLNNLSSSNAKFYVTGVSIANSNGVDITSVSSTIPKIDLDVAHTYVTTANSNVVTVNTVAGNHLSEGQIVYLSTPPAGNYDGIHNSSLGGYFKISHVTNSSFEISVADTAIAGQNFAISGQTATPPYATSIAGNTNTRTQNNGIITADLTADTSSAFYTISVTMGVDDGTGNVQTSIVNYRVSNQQPNALNKVFGADSQYGNGTIVLPSVFAPIAIARLVDENGNELPKINGAYTNSQAGYLQIKAGTSTSNIAIDSLDSREMGNPTVSPTIPGSNRSFSHYFDLNDFFKSNKPTNTGDTVSGSALNFAVEQRFRDNPNLISLGQMIKGPDSSALNAKPNFTYQLNPGDNSVITKLAQLAGTNLNFTASGGLGATTNTLTGYASQIIGGTATNAVTAKNNDTNAQSLLQGYQENSSAVSGVNLDTELANTVIYQNAYAASARVITVANQLFDTLLSSFQ